MSLIGAMSDLRSLFSRQRSSPSAKTNDQKNRSRTSLLSPKSRQGSLGGATVYEESNTPSPDPSTPSKLKQEVELGRGGSEETPDTSLETPRSTPLEKSGNPVFAIQAPTPDLLSDTANGRAPDLSADIAENPIDQDSGIPGPTLPRPDAAIRRQSLLQISQSKLLETILDAASPGYFGPAATQAEQRSSSSGVKSNMKIWVKRLNASATLIPISEDDLVDDVRDRILKKYANSLGRSFDAPDVTLRIIPRDHSHRHSYGERTLGPEESIAKILAAYFPGGQGINEALVIDVPRRTPRHSPRPAPYYLEDSRPVESGTDYFPVIPAGQHSPHLPSNISVASGHAPSHHLPLHSMSVVNTGQVPPLPSPGVARGPRHIHRPKFGRTQTTSPTVIGGTSSSQVHGRLF